MFKLKHKKCSFEFIYLFEVVIKLFPCKQVVLKFSFNSKNSTFSNWLKILYWLKLRVVINPYTLDWKNVNTLTTG